jgi:hypothetical protein
MFILFSMFILFPLQPASNSDINEPGVFCQMKQSDREELKKLIQDRDNVEKMIVYFERLQMDQQEKPEDKSSAGQEQNDSVTSARAIVGENDGALP